MIRKVQSSVLILCLILLTSFKTDAYASEVESQKSVSILAVLPFGSENAAQSTWFSEMVTDLIRSYLFDLSSVLVLTKKDTLETLAASEMSLSENVTYKKLKDFRRKTNADWLVLGMIQENQKKFSVKIKMLSLQNPEQSKTFDVHGKTDSIPLSLKEMAAQVVSGLNMELNASDKEKLLKPDDLDYEALSTLYRAKVQKAKGNFDFCEKLLSEILKEHPQFSLAACELADLYAQQRQTIKAVKILNQALEKDPNSIQLLLTVAGIYRDQESFLDAKEYYERVLLVSPNETEALLNLTQIFIRQNLFELAIDSAQKGIQNSGFKSRFYTLIGDIYKAKEDLVFALEMYKRSLKIDPQNLDALKKQGIIHALLGDYETAQNLYSNAVKSEDIKETKGEFNSDTDVLTPSQAREVQLYLDQVREDPKNVLALNALGTAYEQERQWTKAEESFKSAIQVNPNFQPAYFNLAVNLAKQNKSDQAIQYFEGSIKLNPAHLASYLQFGDFYWSQRKHKHAIKVWEEGLEHLPNCKELVEKVVHAYARLNKWRNVVKTYKAYARNSNGESQASLLIGRILLQYGKDKKALKYFKKGLKEDPDRSDTYKDLAVYYDFYGNDPEKAVEYYETYLSLEPESDKKEDIQIRMAKIKEKLELAKGTD